MSIGQKLWYEMNDFVTRNAHLKYESLIYIGSEVMTKIKIFVHEHVDITDGMTKVLWTLNNEYCKSTCFSLFSNTLSCCWISSCCSSTFSISFSWLFICPSTLFWSCFYEIKYFFLINAKYVHYQCKIHRSNSFQCNCGTYNRAPWWTSIDPLKPEDRPGAHDRVGVSCLAKHTRHDCT